MKEFKGTSLGTVDDYLMAMWNHTFKTGEDLSGKINGVLVIMIKKGE